MLNLEFVIVDVFTERPLMGNPLAVFPDADGVEDAMMQSIAREFNFSETTFAVTPRDPHASRRLRCFSPRAEVFGAGHNALGAWWVILKREAVGDVDTVWQELGDRVLPVHMTRIGGELRRLAMTQPFPTLEPITAGDSKFLAAMGLRADASSPGLSACVATSGATSHALIPVRGLDDLMSIVVDGHDLAAAARPLGCEGCYAFALETRDTGSLAHARGFFPGIGIAEDPATGSAAGPLVAYLREQDIVPHDEWVTIEQGDAMDRPSRIQVRVSHDRVEVGGSCAVVATGRLTL